MINVAKHSSNEARRRGTYIWLFDGDYIAPFHPFRLYKAAEKHEFTLLLPTDCRGQPCGGLQPVDVLQLLLQFLGGVKVLQ